jgi:O-antigen ligase
MDREVLDKACKRAIWFLTIVTLLWGPLAFGSVQTPAFLVLLGLTLLLMLLWILRLWLGSDNRILWPSVCFGVLLFTGYAIGRTLVADIEYVARGELTRILVYAALFFAILNNFQEPRSIKTAVYALVLLGMIEAVYATFQFATGSDRVWHWVRPPIYQGRGSGTYICPNHLAGFLAMVMPMGLALTIKGRMNPAMRILVGYASAAMLVGLALTFSRGGWLAAGAAILLLLLWIGSQRGHRLAALLILILLTASAAAFFTQSDRAAKRIEQAGSHTSPESSKIRLHIWHGAWQMWQDHPWWGVGPGHFDHRFPAYRHPDVQARPGYAHNDHLNTLADFGIAGVLPLAALFLALFWSAARSWHHVRRDAGEAGNHSWSDREAIILGATLGLVALLVHAIFDFNWQIPANAVTAVALAAFLASQSRFASGRSSLRPQFAGRIAITIAACALTAWLGFTGWHRAAEHYWLQIAGGESQATTRKIEALERAAAIQPSNAQTHYQLGEIFRQSSFQGLTGYDALGQNAILHFERSAALNPYDPHPPMRIGMCLDWLGRHDDAAPYYERAYSLDPNYYYILAHIGWHHVQIGDLQTAKTWFERSIVVHHAWKNPIARAYLEIVKSRLMETRAQPAENP